MCVLKMIKSAPKMVESAIPDVDVVEWLLPLPIMAECVA